MQGHVPIFAALVAACSVHAFVLFYASPTHVGSPHLSSLQITTLEQNESKIADKAPNTIEKTAHSKNNNAESIAQNMMQTLSAHQPELRQPKQQLHEVKQTNVIKPSATKDAKSKSSIKEASEQASEEARRNKQKNSSAALPNHVQQIILANISYPRYARRKGIEGKAKFELSMLNQAIKKVTLVSSSGYAILDQAAFKALASLEKLPLNDGFYSLPVVFKLQ